MKPRLWIALLGAAAVIAAVVLTSSGGAGGPLDPVARAADTTVRAGGAHMSVTGSVSVPSLSQPIGVSGNGTVNFSANEGDFNLTMSGLPQSAQSALHASTLEMNELFKDSSLYVGSPLFAGQLPSGARWIKLDLGKVQQAFGMDPSSLTSGFDPSQYLRDLQRAGYGSRVVGHEAVYGTLATHYAGTLDLLKAAEAQPGSDRAQLRRAFQAVLARAGLRTAPVDVWVDAKGLVRKIAMTLTMGQLATVSMQVEYFDFGATPSISAPPASEVLDATKQALQAIPSGA